MLTFILHLLLALLCFIGAAASFSSWKLKRDKNDIHVHLFLFFAFFTGYHACLSVPFLLTGGNLMVMAWGYNFAMAFIYLALAPMYSIMVFQILGVPVARIGNYIKMLLIVGLFVVLIQAYDFRLPIIDSSGFVIWNNNLIAGGLTAAFCLAISVIWIFIYFKNKPVNLDALEKLKAVIYTIGGLMFSLASLYFFARSIFMIAIAFILVSVGTILMDILVLIPEKRVRDN
jgi:hypothetical protein